MLVFECEVGCVCEVELCVKMLVEELFVMKEILVVIECECVEDFVEDDVERYSSDFAEKNVELEYFVVCL